MTDRYGRDVLAPGGPGARDPRTGRLARSAPAPERVAAEAGLVVEDAETGWCGTVVRVEKAGGMHVVNLEDRAGRVRAFPLGPGFLLDGAAVVLTSAAAAARASAGLSGPTGAAGRTASGSTAVRGARARVAQGSRLFVEGRHDAELVEKVWGDDLRVEGVVVEMLDGVDDLAAAVAGFAPTATRRMGVLVDHLLPGTKEHAEVERARALRRWAPHLRVLGHPYVDVWQSVRPQRLGRAAWPVVPRGTSWKHGVLAALGWPHETQADVAAGWRRILGTVRSYADLEPALLASVEELIDFVCIPQDTGTSGR